MWHLTTSSKRGSKKELRRLALMFPEVQPKGGIKASHRSFSFFPSCSCSLCFWLYRRPSAKPSSETKSRFRGSFAPPFSLLARKNFLSRNRPPAPHSSTYSMRSAGWHSNSSQSFSMFSQATPFPSRNFWSVDWLSSPSVLILLVL